MQVLVWSAASGVGHWLTQLAHNSGLRVFATASPKHTERLKTLGAVDVFDYRDPEAGAKIHAATSGKLAYVGVCEAAQADVPNIVDALGRGGGTLALAAAPLQAPPGADKPINAVFSVVFTLLGKVRTTAHVLRSKLKWRAQPITGIFEIPAMPEHRAAATTYLARIATLLRDGKVATLPVRVFGGLDSVGDAMQELRAGKVRSRLERQFSGADWWCGAGQRREDRIQSVRRQQMKSRQRGSVDYRTSSATVRRFAFEGYVP